MAFTIPNNADAFNTAQAQVDKVDVDILVQARDQSAGVITGCAVTFSSALIFAVAAGTIISSKIPQLVTAGNVTLNAADGTNPRFDLIVADSTGALQKRTGTAAAAPVFPTPTAGDTVLAAIYVPASETTSQANRITDKRVFVYPNIMVVVTADVTKNNSTTFGDVTGLALALAANEIWHFEITLLLNNASITSDYKFQFTFPSGATIFWGPQEQGAAAVGSIVWTWDPVISTVTPTALLIETGSLAIGGFAGTSGLSLRGIVRNGSTAGKLQLQFAQNTLTVENTKVLKDSCMMGRRIA